MPRKLVVKVLMKITFLLPVASDAHLQKRVKALENLGVQSKVLAFEREWYPGKPWPGGYTSLGQLQHRHYYKRFVPLMKALPMVRAAAKESDVIYAFNMDTLLLGWLASRALDRRPKIVYEVSDIEPVFMGNSVLSRGVRWLERFLLRRVSSLVVTSETYIDGYYQGIQSLSHLHYQVIENKLDANTISQPQSPMTRSEWDGVLRIGYFGVIRCRRSWGILKKAVEKGNGRVQVYVRGIPVGLEGFEDVQSAPSIDYGGPYIAPDDLPAMYEQVDIAWIASYLTKAHLCWSRTNRFYEACFFKKPMFAQVGTQDGQIVESLGLGVCVNLMDVDETVDRILSVNEMELGQWQQNVAGLPAHIYTYTDEHERLLKSIQ